MLKAIKDWVFNKFFKEEIKAFIYDFMFKKSEGKDEDLQRFLYFKIENYLQPLLKRFGASMHLVPEGLVVIRKYTNEGTISLERFMNVSQYKFDQLIEQIDEMKLNTSRHQPSASEHKMQMYVYGGGALSKQEIDECVAYCLMIKRGQIKLEQKNDTKRNEATH